MQLDLQVRRVGDGFCKLKPSQCEMATSLHVDSVPDKPDSVIQWSSEDLPSGVLSASIAPMKKIMVKNKIMQYFKFRIFLIQIGMSGEVLVKFFDVSQGVHAVVHLFWDFFYLL